MENTEESNRFEKSQVEVRSVFINCISNEELSENVYEPTRFEREELFKHNALRNCKKKLAVTLKITSDPNETANDEYIPIEHVFDQSGEKKVRLVDPYVLRLRRQPPVQAYKIRKIEIANLVSKDESVQTQEGSSNRQLRRNLISNKLTGSDENQELYSKYYGAKPLLSPNKLIRQKLNAPSDKSNYAHVCSDRGNDSSKQRYRRHEYNVVIDRDTAVWPSTNKYFSASNDTKNYKTKAKMRSTLYKEEVNRLRSKQDLIKEPSDKNININLDNVQYDYSYNTDGITVKPNFKTNDDSHENNFERKLHNKAENSEFENKQRELSEEKYILYEIGVPELRNSINVQLFEKLTSSDGKTSWLDLTKGEPASVSSTQSEWNGQDLNIKYRSSEYLTKDDFTLPTTTKFGLLVSMGSEDKNTADTNSIIVSMNKYLIVPVDDIVDFDTGSHFKYNDSFINDGESFNQPVHRITLRNSKPIMTDIDGLRIIIEESEVHLILPYKRSLRSQIDLEARADENQIIRVGAHGRIIIAVSDNTRRTRTALIVQATNMGLAAAKFRVKVRDCGPELQSAIENGEMIKTDLVLIPPRHTKRLRLEIPNEFLEKKVSCSVALMNEEEDQVAVRDVTIKKGDRCFCVWYCDCVCLSDDPDLQCKELSEPRVTAAGLSMRDAPRHIRSVHYPDDMKIDCVAITIGVLIFLLFIGFLKAVIGVICRPVGMWGLQRVIKPPRRMNQYYERSLKNKKVVYDAEGWPLHPDTCQRTVRFLSRPMEFMLNVILFLTIPCLVMCDFLCVVVFHPCTKMFRTVFVNSSSSLSCEEELTKKEKKSKKKFRTPDTTTMQCTPPSRRRRHRRKDLRKWMSPQAEMLSKEVLRSGLMIPLNSLDRMKPLLESHHGRTESSYETDVDDTEYVLHQMQKSRETLNVRHEH